MISVSIPNFTEDLLGIVIKSAGKENFHSSHIVLRAIKMLSQESPPPPPPRSFSLNNFKLKWQAYDMVIWLSYDFVFNSSVNVGFKF
jgi:hypothetical protein